MTFYLKYRSQKISELDLVEVRNTILKVAKSDEIPHAFLFSGPRGAGKTSSARILAKVVNCENLKDGEPCNECDPCLEISKGISLNVIEIDAASHRGVDDIRALRETVKLSPSGGKKKVYIIDEAHMLTTEAANALLKTLEEPPSHAMFILATTAPEKLLDTIRSRCVTVVFRKGSKDEVAQALERAAKGEGIRFEEGALEEISKRVDGSFREAHKVLEHLSFGEKKITRDKVLDYYQISSATPELLLSCLAKKDILAAFSEIDRIVEQGVNLKVYTTHLIEMLRQIMRSKVGAENSSLEIAGEFNSSAEVGQLIEIFSDSWRQLSTAVIPQLPLEVAIAKWCGDGKPQALKINSANKTPTKQEEKQAISSSQDEAKIESTNQEGVRIEEEQRPVNVDASLEDAWQEIIKRVRVKNHSIEALLRATKPVAFSGQKFEIEVFYVFHKERLESDQYRTIVEQVLRDVFKNPISLVCQLSSSKQRAVDLVNITDTAEEDIVKIAEEIFGGETGKVSH